MSKGIARRNLVFLIGLIIIIGVIVTSLITYPFNPPQPEEEARPLQPPSPGPTEFEILVEFVESKYKTVISKPAGWFKTGQDADILLSGIDFNNAGGPLLFNHPGGIASDGQHLILADRNNNRVLIWNKLPTGNEKPDIVIGQKDFISNNPGKGLDQLNWPVDVATDGKRLLVADTENDRILIWNSFPTKNGEKADIVLQGSEERGIDTRGNILWPWAVWTDGEKVVVASTGSGQVMIWNSFPTRDNQPPDIIIKLPEFGTPRSIGSDGKHLVVGDHNAPGGQGTFFWKTFPTKDDQKFDFFIGVSGTGEKPQPGEEKTVPGQILWSTFTEDGKFIAFGIQIYIWNSFPEDKFDTPDYIIGSRSPAEPGYRYEGGDGSGIVAVGNRLYITLSNGNKVVVFNSLPNQKDQKPDFAIGAPDVDTNTLETYFFITNPVPITDGEHLFVLSDYDKKLYIWKALPDESGAKPDIVYTFPEPIWDGVAKDGKLLVVGGNKLYYWDSLPFNGEKPSVITSIGNVEFKGLSGVAIDDKYLYLADIASDKIYVWEGIPKKDEIPKIVVDIEHPSRLSSDGNYLVTIDTFGHRIKILPVNKLSENPKPFIVDKPVGKSSGKPFRGEGFNLPQDAIIYNGSLFVADTGFNRIVIWNNVEDAIAGKPADIILGENDLYDTRPEIGRNKVFWPAALDFDGSFLWVGEYKFSGRLLRFSVKKG